MKVVRVELFTVGINGAWAVYPHWFDAEGACIRDTITGVDPKADNVRMDLLAALEGLRKADGIGGPIDILSVNESNVRTVAEWLPGWKMRGWRKPDGKTPANADLWMEIDALSQRNHVRWVKRKPHEIDGADTFGVLQDGLGQLAKRRR